MGSVRRWAILAIFSLISMMNEVIWISLSSVSSILQKYYDVSVHRINLISMIFSAMYVTVPLAVYILNRYGIKVTIVIGALCNAIASALRLIGYTRNGFIYALLGNAFGGMGQSFLIFIPPTLSTVWFGEKERGRASSIGVLMNILGVAVGFLMGSMFVPNSKDYDGVVKHGMFLTLLIQAVFCGLLLVASLIVIQKRPALPPSHSQAQAIKRQDVKREIRKLSKAGVVPTELIRKQSLTQSTGLFNNWRYLLTNITFHLLTQAYGLYFGMFITVNALLNEMAIQHFPGKERLIGMMGFASVIFGLIGIMLAGVWIDKTHRYKSISVVTLAACVTSFSIFVLVLKYSGNFPATFACYCLFGFLSYAYLSVGLEFTAEIMYPIKESILSFIVLFVGSLYGVTGTFGFGIVVDKAGAEFAGYGIAGLYFVAFICVVMVKGELKRLSVDLGTDNFAANET